jgi:hypothetical protein
MLGRTDSFVALFYSVSFPLKLWGLRNDDCCNPAD